MKVRFLSKKEISETTAYIGKYWPYHMGSSIKVLKSYETPDGQLLIGENIVAIKTENSLIIPHLTQDQILDSFPEVIVDMGAIKYVCNGANIMRPGIIQFSSFEEQSIVVVRDQIHRKAVAVGLSVIDGNNGRNLVKGVIINNIHYVGDVFWELKKDVRV